jgi:hypothetical protein
MAFRSIALQLEQIVEKCGVKDGRFRYNQRSARRAGPLIYFVGRLSDGLSCRLENAHVDCP